MVIPENTSLFEEFKVEDFKVFVEKKILLENPDEIEFLIVSIGNFILKVEELK